METTRATASSRKATLLALDGRKPAELYRVRLTRLGRKWWLKVNDVALFDQVDTPRLPALGFGLLTWDTSARFESVKLSRLAVR